MPDNTVEVNNTPTYAVFRNGVRVSDSEYENKMQAQHEYNYWAGILKRWPDGSKLDVKEVIRRRRPVTTEKASA